MLYLFGSLNNLEKVFELNPKRAFDEVDAK
jgi:hypothetical protein